MHICKGTVMSNWDDLAEILEDMDVPEMRVTNKDVRWLSRNLGVRNGDHPKIQEAKKLLKDILSGKKGNEMDNTELANSLVKLAKKLTAEVTNEDIEKDVNDESREAAQFVDPFTGVVPRTMNDREVLRAIRQAIAAEEEAVHLYESIVDATDDVLVAAVLQDIANEEKVHVGELQELLNRMSPDEIEFMEDGQEEVQDTAEEKIASDIAELSELLGDK